MPRILLFLLLVILSIKVAGQKVLVDKKDPFTGARHIVLKSMPIGSGYEVGGSVVISDTIVLYQLCFLAPSVGIRTTSADSIKNECRVMNAGGEVFIGKWTATTSAPVGIKVYDLNYYSFSKSDAVAMASGEITSVKIGGWFFDVPNKNRGAISKIFTTLIKKQGL